MRSVSKIGKVLPYAVLVSGALLPAALVIALPEFYHHSDIGIQMVWMQQWNKGWREIYNTCSSCDYPLMGTFIAAGIPKLLSRIGVDNLAQGFRICLAFVDGANVLLVFLLFRILKVRRAALWAGVIGLSLSSWAGGAVWGNIDDVSHFLLLVILLWIVVSNLTGKIHLPLFLVVCSVLMSFLILTKHLNIFNLFALEFMLMVNIFATRKRAVAASAWLLQVALLLVCIFGWDVPLTIDRPYVSHLQMIWGTPGRMGDFLSNNGFNLWMLLGRDMLSSSAVPLFPDSPVAVLRALTPFNAGVVLFLAAASSLAAAVAWRIGKRRTPGAPWLDRNSLLDLIAFLALINLAYNVTLPGTHERYLYSFYPLVILAFLGLQDYDRRFSLPLVALLVGGANVYGVFVLGILTGDFAFSNDAHRVAAVFHAGLLLLVSAVFFRYLSARRPPPVEGSGGR